MLQTTNQGRFSIATIACQRVDPLWTSCFSYLLNPQFHLNQVICSAEQVLSYVEFLLLKHVDQIPWHVSPT